MNTKKAYHGTFYFSARQFLQNAPLRSEYSESCYAGEITEEISYFKISHNPIHRAIKDMTKAIHGLKFYYL